VSELFREEAVRHATRRLAGEVMLAASLPGLVLTALAVVTVAGGLVFAATATYARKETVVGWVAPQAGLIRPPQRMAWTIPLSTRRSSTCFLPRTSVGNNGSIRAHCASENQKNQTSNASSLGGSESCAGQQRNPFIGSGP
jgi:hypothetical protein